MAPALEPVELVYDSGPGSVMTHYPLMVAENAQDQATTISFVTQKTALSILKTSENGSAGSGMATLNIIA